MRTELLPWEDPALLPGSDRIDIGRVLVAELPDGGAVVTAQLQARPIAAGTWAVSDSRTRVAFAVAQPRPRRARLRRLQLGRRWRSTTQALRSGRAPSWT